MNNGHISIPFRKTHLTLTVTEAQQLFEDLQVQLEKVRAHDETLQQPRISDGYIDLDAFYEFFVQYYPERSALRSHAGRLFSRLTTAARFDWVAFNVVCKKCGRAAKEECPAGNYLHMNCATDLKIEVASLKKHSKDIFEKNLHQVGPAVKEDLRILLAALPEA